jgi:cystathionine beta-lyase/cystathionine gamma-synthase
MSLKKERSHWSVNTLLNHPIEVPLEDGNRPLIQPIYNSAKFTLSDSIPYWDQFVYGRVSNPGLRRLELSLAEFQGRDDCIVVSSGIAALSGVFMGLLKSGDHMITFRDLYKPGRVFIKDYLSRYGIESSVIKLGDYQVLEKAIIVGKTKLIHFESPSNPNLEIVDIEKVLEIAKRNHVLVSMDGTFAGLHQHKKFDVDIMIQSLTKFGNGHGDVIAGAISGKKEIIKVIREMTLYLGAHLDPQAVYLIERGLKTYMLRYERQTKTACEVAHYLSNHPKVKVVRYPGLKDHKNHALALKQMDDMGAVISFEINPEVAPSADKFCHKLNLIQIAASLGATESIICPTQTFFGLDLSIVDREEMGINPYSLRLSIGLEDTRDIIHDLENALVAI